MSVHVTNQNDPNCYVRRLTFCPACGNTKERGLLICWTCNAQLKSRHDGRWGTAIETLLARVEHSCRVHGAALFPHDGPVADSDKVAE